MRALLPIFLIVLATPVLIESAPLAAAEKKPVRLRPAGPHAIGHFDDWVAATNSEAGQPSCYAFTRVQSSVPALPGRSEVVLTITHRASGRDAVAITAGFAYAAGAAVTVSAEPASFEFYTGQRSAFSRDGHATVAALLKAKQLVAKSPAPKGVTVTDSFSLKGFNQAYAAINKACPLK